MEIGKNIKQLRLNAGLTQIQLAEKASLKLANIKAYEINRVSPPLDSLEKIANALNVSVVEFFGIGDSFILQIPKAAFTEKEYALLIYYLKYNINDIVAKFNSAGENKEKFILDKIREDSNKAMQGALAAIDWLNEQSLYGTEEDANSTKLIIKSYEDKLIQINNNFDSRRREIKKITGSFKTAPTDEQA